MLIHRRERKKDTPKHWSRKLPRAWSAPLLAQKKKTPQKGSAHARLLYTHRGREMVFLTRSCCSSANICAWSWSDRAIDVDDDHLHPQLRLTFTRITGDSGAGNTYEKTRYAGQAERKCSESLRERNTWDRLKQLMFCVCLVSSQQLLKFKY